MKDPVPSPTIGYPYRLPSPPHLTTCEIRYLLAIEARVSEVIYWKWCAGWTIDGWLGGMDGWMTCVGSAGFPFRWDPDVTCQKVSRLFSFAHLCSCFSLLLLFLYVPVPTSEN